ncbi:hypothetical protein QVD17_17752 [Tagetes erecta]|uniref:Uncharacterized protein n=1 Tax=Tagetes erecta TaxID=13708 RepID=A0AAD8P1R7_TARER|nr:hypothetical protein QVD17_17752 [Tagetes erecta]
MNFCAKDKNTIILYNMHACAYVVYQPQILHFIFLHGSFKFHAISLLIWPEASKSAAITLGFRFSTIRPDLTPNS